MGLPCGPGIYRIVQRGTTRTYIGSSRNVEYRKRSHFTALRSNKHGNPFLQNVWNKYGEGSLELTLIEECDPDFLLERESHWIKHYNCARPNGFNLSSVRGSPSGVVRSPEYREQKRQRMLGTKIHPNAQAALIAYHTGRKQSDETKKKQADAHRKHGPEIIAAARALVISGLSKHQAAKRLGIPSGSIGAMTRGLGRKKAIITSEMSDRFIEMYAAGCSIKFIAKEFSVDPKSVSVRVVLLKSVEENRKRHMSACARMAIPVEKAEEIVRLVSQGWAMCKIGKHLGVHNSVVSRYSRGLGGRSRNYA